MPELSGKGEPNPAQGIRHNCPSDCLGRTMARGPLVKEGEKREGNLFIRVWTCVCVLSRSAVSDSVTLWTSLHQGSSAVGFSGKNIKWVAMPLSWDLLTQGLNLSSVSPALQAGSYHWATVGKPWVYIHIDICLCIHTFIYTLAQKSYHISIKFRRGKVCGCGASFLVLFWEA